MEAVLQVVQRINFYLSDYILVFLLIGTGLYFSVRTRFVQVRCFGEGMRAVFGASVTEVATASPFIPTYVRVSGTVAGSLVGFTSTSARV